VLVRLQGGGHHAWGESCPPYIPSYSAEHTLATFHAVREHLAPRIIGQEIGSVHDLLSRLDFVKATSSRGPRWRSPGGSWLKFRPGWDLDMLAAVRSTFPSFTFHIDCNAAYSPADTELFRTLDRYRLAMIEQPLADDGLSLVNHADLQAKIETPICLDESALSLAHVEAAIRLGACRVINING
jgi:L-alanine-DL-glutamate epimerase-like enolase superfamily enzyme